MGRRLAVFLGGIGVLIVILAATALITRATRPPAAASTTRPAAQSLTPSLIPSLLPPGTAGATPIETSNRIPTPTPHRTFRLSMKRGSASDPATGVRVTLVLVSVGPVTAGRVVMGVGVLWRNASNRRRMFSARSLFAVSAAGATYAASPFQSAGKGTLRPSASHFSSVQFSLPARSTRLMLYWNDNGRLLPPRQIGTARIG